VQQSNPSTFLGLDSKFDEFFNSPTFSLLDALNFEFLDAPNTLLSGETINSSNLSICGKSHSNLVPAKDIIYLFGERSRSLLLSSDAITRQLPNTHKIHGNFAKDFESSDRCFLYALDTPNKLFASDATVCMMLLGEHSQNRSSDRRLLSVHTIISRNKQAIDEMSRILECSCSANSFLLTIVALVVFKVLDWYAHAAKTATASKEETFNSNPYSSFPSPRQRPAKSTVGSYYQQKATDYNR
jgi:Aflatoxin regulatory protein